MQIDEIDHITFPPSAFTQSQSPAAYARLLEGIACVAQRARTAQHRAVACGLAGTPLEQELEALAAAAEALDARVMTTLQLTDAAAPAQVVP